MDGQHGIQVGGAVDELTDFLLPFPVNGYGCLRQARIEDVAGLSAETNEQKCSSHAGPLCRILSHIAAHVGISWDM